MVYSNFLEDIMARKLTLTIIFTLGFLSLGIVTGAVFSDSNVINKAVAGPGW